MTFYDQMTLGEARAVLRTLVDDGTKCPCCKQFAKVYRRTIYGTMARDLIKTARAGGFEARRWVEVGPLIGRTSPDLVKLRYWKMLEAQPGEREDGSNRVGWWRLTEPGVAWLRGRTTVPKYARIYDGRCLQLVGDPITITDALGTKFDYRELMEGA